MVLFAARPKDVAGGTQRLTHAIGKSKAMEMVLTGNFMTAKEAEQAGTGEFVAINVINVVVGLVSKVLPADKVVDEAIKLGNLISKYSKPVVMMAKEAVNAAYDLNLTEGTRFERRLFQSSFALVRKCI